MKSQFEHDASAETETETKTLTEATIYWDSQDPTNEGWAFRLRWSDGSEETGEWAAGKSSVPADEVVALAWHAGLDIESGDVAVDGLCGTWTRP